MLVGPECKGRFRLKRPVLGNGDEVESGTLACGSGHAFPVVGGVPRLLGARSRRDVDRARESFSREWTHHELGDRTWYEDLETRVRTTFIEVLGVPREELATKAIVDAGCGNGSQSVAFSRPPG
jgi:uncharacterized protein YbaR (Trm112 family)